MSDCGRTVQIGNTRRAIQPKKKICCCRFVCQRVQPGQQPEKPETDANLAALSERHQPERGRERERERPEPHRETIYLPKETN